MKVPPEKHPLVGFIAKMTISNAITQKKQKFLFNLIFDYKNIRNFLNFISIILP